MADNLIVKSAAYLDLCPICGAHGWIVFGNGTRSKLITTHRQAKVEIEEAMIIGILAEDELPELKRQICASAIVVEDPLAEQISRDVEMICDHRNAEFVPRREENE